MKPAAIITGISSGNRSIKNSVKMRPEGFVWTWTYQWDLSPLCFPSDGAQTAPYPIYDRWCDFFNVTTEASSTDIARSFAIAAWLATQTSLASQPWRSTNATIIVPNTTKLPAQPVTVTLQVADTNLSGARITWEALGQEPTFGGTAYTSSPVSQDGPQWVEAEVQWPDGRRAFATNSIFVSADTPPELSAPIWSDGAFSFTLVGAPLGTYVIQTSTDLVSWDAVATNTLPASGVLPISDSTAPTSSRRNYRAVKAQ